MLLLALMCFSGCTISKQQEIEIGRQAAPEFEQQFGGLVQDQRLQQYVQDVGESLVRHTERQDLPWQFRVLRSDQINAFALPGGFIYITQGLLQRLDNEAQLAAILGHEAGHVAERHSVRQMQRAQLIQGGSLLAGLVGQSQQVASIANLAGGLALMSYSREQEREADLHGLRYLAREGYRPEAVVEVMQTLAQAGGGSQPEFFSSHPRPENRQEYLNEAIQARYSDVITRGRTNEDRFRQVVRPVGGGGFSMWLEKKGLAAVR
jgi:beta-barrel assembly-enhancing protease